MRPSFNGNGTLSEGIHLLTWAEFLSFFGVTPHRLNLISGIEAAVRALSHAGCHTIYIDGSFVTNKEIPDDYDACWDINGVNPTLIDPILLKFDDGRIAMRTKYKGDLFPAQLTEGITGKTFLEFFQQDKGNGDPKGIVKLKIRG